MTQKSNIYAVILAGGAGTRFWPASRLNVPKQFLKVTGSRTLLQEAIWRIIYKINSSNIFIVTNKEFKKEVQKQTADFRIPKENILLEPTGKNTAPAICWAASTIFAYNEDAVIAVLPSDHLILNTKTFTDYLLDAVELAEDDNLVTFGIVPTRPETGYGYLGTKRVRRRGKSLLEVTDFIEKPKLKKATEIYKKRNHFWNSGMFVFKATTILEEYDLFLRKVSKHFEQRVDQEHVEKIWHKLPNISIDYGVMEKSDRVVAIPAKDIGWSDLGSFESLMEVLDKDGKGNVLRGDVLNFNSRNTLVWGDKRLITTVGLDNIAIVDTPDALLICPIDQSQKVREVVNSLKKSKRKELKSSKNRTR